MAAEYFLNFGAIVAQCNHNYESIRTELNTLQAEIVCTDEGTIIHIIFHTNLKTNEWTSYEHSSLKEFSFTLIVPYCSFWRQTCLSVVVDPAVTLSMAQIQESSHSPRIMMGVLKSH